MFGKAKKIQETEEFKKQKEEAQKKEAIVEEVGIRRESGKRPEELTMDDLVASNTEVWYRARQLELLSHISSTLEEINEMNKQENLK